MTRSPREIELETTPPDHDMAAVDGLQSSLVAVLRRLPEPPV